MYCTHDDIDCAAYDAACEAWFCSHIADMTQKTGFAQEHIGYALGALTWEQLTALSRASEGYCFGDCQEVEAAVGKLVLQALHDCGWRFAQEAVGQAMQRRDTARGYA